MEPEGEGRETEQMLGSVCDKIVQHLETIKSQIEQKQTERSRVDALVPNIGGQAAHHFESEIQLIDQNIQGVRQRDPAFLQRFLIRPMEGLELSEEEKKILEQYSQESGNKAA